MNRSQRKTTWLLPLALAGLFVACNGGDTAAGDGYGSPDPATAAPSGAPADGAGQGWVMDSVEVPTTAEAYEEVRDDITQENVDAELEKLMQEIEDGQ